MGFLTNAIQADGPPPAPPSPSSPPPPAGGPPPPRDRGPDRGDHTRHKHFYREGPGTPYATQVVRPFIMPGLPGLGYGYGGGYGYNGGYGRIVDPYAYPPRVSAPRSGGGGGSRLDSSLVGRYASNAKVGKDVNRMLNRIFKKLTNTVKKNASSEDLDLSDADINNAVIAYIRDEISDLVLDWRP